MRFPLGMSRAVVALCVLTAVLRLPALIDRQPIDDESPYAVVANEILHGGRPYADAVERKPPLLFWTYAAIFGIGGMYNWRALHLAGVLWTLATMWGLYVTARSVAGHRAGLIAAGLYSVFQPWGTWKNLAFNGEMLMNLPLAWAWAIALSRGGRWHAARPELFAAGALSCAAFLLKQPAAIAVVPLAVYPLLPSYRASREITTRQSCAQVGWLGGGFVMTLAAAIALLHHQGILRDAFYWTIINHDVPIVFWARGIGFTAAFIGACLPLTLGAALALVHAELWTGKEAERLALIGLLTASLVGVAASGRFYPHYYIQLVPPLAVLAASYYQGMWAGTLAARGRALNPRIVCAWVAVTALAFFAVYWSGLRLREQPSETGQYLAAHSSPDDRIFVWGQAPQLYLDARRRPASRYILTFPLTGFIFGGSFGSRDTSDRTVPGSWELLESDFAQHPPVYIVDVRDPENARYPVARFPVLARLLAEQFEPAAQTAEGTIYRRRILD